MPREVRRLVLPVLASALAAACASVVEVTPQVTIPAGSAIYKLAPTLLTDEFVDTTAGQHFALTWLSGEAFQGSNCLAFLPRTPTDSIGSFVFALVGQNVGRVERRNSGVIDTVTGYFIDPQSPGTRGTYAVDATGKLTLNWSDGTRNRYFAPSAVIRLFGDTVESRADLRARADSIRDQWHVYWVRSPTCP